MIALACYNRVNHVTPLVGVFRATEEKGNDVKQNWGADRFETEMSANDQEGWISVDLHVHKGNEKTMVGRVCYWDAMGQFFLETFERDVPLVIIEDLIKEAKEKIRTS